MKYDSSDPVRDLVWRSSQSPLTKQASVVAPNRDSCLVRRAQVGHTCEYIGGGVSVWFDFIWKSYCDLQPPYIPLESLDKCSTPFSEGLRGTFSVLNCLSWDSRHCSVRQRYLDISTPHCMFSFRLIVLCGIPSTGNKSWLHSPTDMRPQFVLASLSLCCPILSAVYCHNKFLTWTRVSSREMNYTLP